MYSFSLTMRFFSLTLIFIGFPHLTLPNENYKETHEYKYSFKGPNLSQPNLGIPFWNHSFDAVPGTDQVRIVPSLKAKHGAVWSKFPFSHDAWKVEVSFRVHGRGKVGADGFVIWYVEIPNQEGPVFGSIDNWKGMGVFFDSFDNDGKKNNPYISVMLNDGTVSYSHATDGFDQMKGGCLRDFRNRAYPVKVQIQYIEQTLKVFVGSGNTNTEDYELCTEINDVSLPKDYFFGISGATGGLADDHDILSFTTWSMQKKESEEGKEETVDEQTRLQEEERKRIQEEYEKSLQDFYTEQEKYKENHPDQAKKEETKPEDLFQGSSSQELQAIFEVQNKIQQQISNLASSMATIISKQDDLHVKLDEKTSVSTGSVQPIEFEKFEKLNSGTLDAILGLQPHLDSLKTSVSTINEHVVRISATGGGGAAQKPHEGVASLDYESKKQMLDVQARLDAMHQTLQLLHSQQGKKPQLMCPEPEMPSCVPLAGLVVVAIIQVVVLLAYHSLKQSREDAAKKFF